MTPLPQYLVEAGIDPEEFNLYGPDGEFDDDAANELIQSLFTGGALRKKELEERIKPRNGTYYIQHAYKGYEADFTAQANYDYLKEKYDFLHSSNSSMCIDSDEAAEECGDLERYLAQISDEDWTSFLDDLDSLENYPSLDDDKASALESEAADEWMKSDGLGDLKKELLKYVTDSFTAFLVSRLTEAGAWEFFRDKEAYPENQGNGTVYLDVSRNVDEDDIQWVLDNADLDAAKAVWAQIKKSYYESNDVGALLEPALLRNTVTTPESKEAFYRLDAASLYRLFLLLVPDSAYGDADRPYWNIEGSTVQPDGTEVDTWEPLGEYIRLEGALEAATRDPRAAVALQRASRREPEEHPELNLGESEEIPSGEEDFDAEAYIQRGGDVIGEEVYRDSKIYVTFPQDVKDWEIATGGRPFNEARRYNNLQVGTYSYYEHYVFVDCVSGEPLTAIVIDYGRISPVLFPTYSPTGRGKPFKYTLSSLLTTDYADSVKSAVLSLMTPQLEDAREDKLANVLTSISDYCGPEVALSVADTHDLNTSVAPAAFLEYFAAKGDFDRVAKLTQTPVSLIDQHGLWCAYDSMSDLSVLFKDKDNAETALSGDAHEWFMYDSMDYDPKDALGWLTPDAVTHIRKLLVGRELFFPEAGDDSEGAYIVVTGDLLSQYKDSEILSWVVDPNSEDEASGVFEDIREALIHGLSDVSEAYSADEAYRNYREAAVEALGGSASKWIDQPGAPGKDMFAVYIRYSTLREAYEAVDLEHLGYPPASDVALEAAKEKSVSNPRVEWEFPSRLSDQAGYYKEQVSQHVLDLEPTVNESIRYVRIA